MTVSVAVDETLPDLAVTVISRLLLSEPPTLMVAVTVPSLAVVDADVTTLPLSTDTCTGCEPSACRELFSTETVAIALPPAD